MQYYLYRSPLQRGAVTNGMKPADDSFKSREFIVAETINPRKILGTVEDYFRHRRIAAEVARESGSWLSVKW